jgi:hypothetical protein
MVIPEGLIFLCPGKQAKKLSVTVIIQLFWSAFCVCAVLQFLIDITCLHFPSLGTQTKSIDIFIIQLLLSTLLCLYSFALCLQYCI